MGYQRCQPIVVYWVVLAGLFACAPPATQAPLQTTMYVYRFNPPAFMEYSAEFQLTDEIPFSIPPNCGLFNVFPPPVGQTLAVELNCPHGPTVLFLDTVTGSISQPITDVDSHLLAWTLKGAEAYLKVDSLGSSRVIRTSLEGEQNFIPIAEFTYDLAASATQDKFLFTVSRGLGQGSELWLAKWDGKAVESLYKDPLHYISYARYSPDESQIAFLKIPDTQTPFTVGELWVMDYDGSDARKLADADTGHGYAANWSSDGKTIAFVQRENPEDQQADQLNEALVSNIYVVDVGSGALTQMTHLKEGRAETPSWSPDGNTLAFNVVIDDRMEVWLADITTGEVQSLTTELTCCAAWMRK